MKKEFVTLITDRKYVLVQINLLQWKIFEFTSNFIFLGIMLMRRSRYKERFEKDITLVIIKCASSFNYHSSKYCIINNGTINTNCLIWMLEDFRVYYII